MPKCLIDGKEAEFKPGENLVEIAKRVGVDIPVFCYHPAMTVVAQCRMCAVEIEKMPKLQTACSTSPSEGMVVHTKSPRVLKQRESVMEFLLVNHPLDCPICDKAGECDLQDFSYQHGSAYMRSTEERRTYLDLDMGPVIQKNMNRCIHCTRCIRFGAEIAGIREMVALRRGNNTEITTLNGDPLQTEYAGNYADICPTGSLTLKDFRFNKRAWMLHKTPSVCEGCSKGCNLELHHHNSVVHRCVPRTNMEINKYWLCDEGRFRFRAHLGADRVIEPALRGQLSQWTQALQEAKRSTPGSGNGVAVLIGSDLTSEEMQDVLTFQKANWASASVFHFGTPGVLSSKDDGKADEILKMKSKTANLNGAEKLGLNPFQSLPSGTKHVVVFRGGRAVVPEFKGVTTVGVGVFFAAEREKLNVVLPGLAFMEKSGTFVNHAGVAQAIKMAVTGPSRCKPISEILMLWANSKEAAA